MPTPTELNSSSIDETNLKAYYRFSTGALTTDSSGAGHTLTAISDPAEVTGVFGKAADLDGNDAYSATDHADFKPTGNFSVGGWFKTSTAGWETIFASSDYKSGKWAGFLLYMYSGHLSILSGKNTGAVSGTDYGEVWSTSAIHYNDGAWHFVVGTWDGTYLKLYVDGAQDGGNISWANAPVYLATNPVRVGCDYETNSAANINFMTGSLDDVWLFNGKALSATEIASLWTHVGKVAGVAFGTIKSVESVTRATVKKIAGE